jgi:hypothetical protein
LLRFENSHDSNASVCPQPRQTHVPFGMASDIRSAGEGLPRQPPADPP